MPKKPTKEKEKPVIGESQRRKQQSAEAKAANEQKPETYHGTWQAETSEERRERTNNELAAANIELAAAQRSRAKATRRGKVLFFLAMGLLLAFEIFLMGQHLADEDWTALIGAAILAFAISALFAGVLIDIVQQAAIGEEVRLKTQAFIDSEKEKLRLDEIRNEVMDISMKAVKTAFEEEARKEEAKPKENDQEQELYHQMHEHALLELLEKLSNEVFGPGRFRSEPSSSKVAELQRRFKEATAGHTVELHWIEEDKKFSPVLSHPDEDEE